jgi:hypothetical protein
MPAVRPKSRDYFLKAIILGSCKAGVFRDYRKHNNKTACRRNKKMPAAVLAHAPTCDVTVDWERDNDLFRVYADVYILEDGSKDVIVRDIHLLDDALQVEAVINTSMFTAPEWQGIEETVVEEWERQELAP